jgi:hypothetical protein
MWLSCCSSRSAPAGQHTRVMSPAAGASDKVKPDDTPLAAGCFCQHLRLTTVVQRPSLLLISTRKCDVVKHTCLPVKLTATTDLVHVCCCALHHKLILVMTIVQHITRHLRQDTWHDTARHSTAEHSMTHVSTCSVPSTRCACLPGLLPPAACCRVWILNSCALPFLLVPTSTRTLSLLQPLSLLPSTLRKVVLPEPGGPSSSVQRPCATSNTTQQTDTQGMATGCVHM